MRNSCLKVKVSLDKRDFVSDAEAARLRMMSLKQSVEDTGTELGKMRNAAHAAGGATAEQTAEFKKLEDQIKSYRSQLTRAANDYQHFRQVSTSPVKSPPPEEPTPSKDGHGKSTGNVGELAHSARSVLDMTLAGQNVGQAVTTEIPRVAQAMGGGLVTILAAGIAAGFVRKIGEGIEKAGELRDKLVEAMRPAPSQGSDTIDAMKKRVEGLDEAVDAAKPKLGALARMMQSLSDDAGKRVANAVAYFSGGVDQGDDAPTDTQQNEYLRNNAISQRAALYEKINAAMGEQNSLAERAFDHGKASVAIDEIRLSKAHALAAAEEELGIAKLKAEINTVRANPYATPDAKQARIEQINEELAPKEMALAGRTVEINREYDLRERLEGRQHAATTLALALEREMLQIKHEGAAVDVKSAEAKLRAAELTLYRGPQDGDDYLANQNKVRAAGEELDMTGRAHRITLDELATQQRIAEFRGSADQRHLNALTEEAGRLQRLFEMYKDRPDDQRGVRVQQARNQQEQDDFAREYANRKDQIHLNTVTAGAGRGSTEAQRLIQEQIKTLQNAMVRNSTADQASGIVTPKDPNLYSQQQVQMRSLIMSAEDLKFAEQQRLATIQAQTREMESQVRGTPAAGRAQANRARTNAAVEQANHDHPDDPRYANEAQRQGDARQLALDAAAQAERENPAARAAAVRAATKQRQDALRYRDNGTTHDADRDGSMIHDKGWDGGPDNAGGTAAAESPDNDPADLSRKHMDGPDHMPEHGHMPDRSFGQPDRTVAPQPDRTIDPNVAGKPTTAAAGFKGDLATVESLLTTISQNCVFRNQ